MKIDLFNEMCKWAGEDALSLLSKLIQRPVGFNILQSKIVKSDKPPLIMKPEEIVVGITTPITGDMKGYVMLLYQKREALSLCDLLLKRKANQTSSFADPEISALNEVSNIIVGHFLSALANPLQIEKLLHKLPIFKCDSYTEIINAVAKKSLVEAEDAYYIEITLHLLQSEIKSFLVVMLSKDDVDKVMDSYGDPPYN